MRPFNLAEARIEERRYCKSHLNRQLRVIVAMVAATLVVIAGSSAYRLSARNKAAQVRSELGDIQARCLDSKRELAMLDARLSQSDWQKQLAEGTKHWLGVLDGMVRCLPGDVWLSKVESSQTDSKVSVDGRAVSFESLSGFASRLRRSPKFSEVRLISTRTNNQSGGTLIDFSVEIKLAVAREEQSADQAPSRAGEVPQVSGVR